MKTINELKITLTGPLWRGNSNHMCDFRPRQVVGAHLVYIDKKSLKTTPKGNSGVLHRFGVTVASLEN